MIERPALRSTPGLAPWQAEPYQLWSVLDMRRFDSDDLMALCYWLGRTAMWLTPDMSLKPEDRPDVRAEDRETIAKGLASIAEDLRKLPLPVSLYQQAVRLQEYATAPTITGGELALLFEELRRNIQTEISEHLF